MSDFKSAIVWTIVIFSVVFLVVDCSSQNNVMVKCLKRKAEGGPIENVSSADRAQCAIEHNRDVMRRKQQADS